LFISAAHSDAHVQRTLEVGEMVMLQMK